MREYLTEYQVRMLDDGPSFQALNPYDRAEAERIAEQVRTGQAKDVFGRRIPAARAHVEYRHVTKWRPVMTGRDLTEPEGVPI